MSRQPTRKDIAQNATAWTLVVAIGVGFWVLVYLAVHAWL